MLEHEHEREECKKLLRRVAEEYGMEVDAIEVGADHLSCGALHNNCNVKCSVM